MKVPCHRTPGIVHDGARVRADSPCAYLGQNLQPAPPGSEGTYSAPFFHGPQMANVSPELAWMFTNSTLPSGVNVAPANSSPSRRGIALRAKSKIPPAGVTPRRKFSVGPSSQRSEDFCGLMQRLSGSSSTVRLGDSKRSVSVSREVS